MISSPLDGSCCPRSSRVMDYSKFDHIGSDSDEEEVVPEPVSVGMTSEPSPAPPTPAKMTPKGADGRLQFKYQDRVIYEWEQSLEEVNIYIKPPPGITKQLLDIKITHKHLSVGLKDTSPFLNEDLGGPVKPGESYWMFSDGEININLQKMNKAELWNSALMGHDAVDDFTKEEQKKKIMLERFQDEHPGFDFSNAEFNGEVPDARNFMGGVRYK